MVKIFKVFVPVSVIALLICESVLLYGCYIAGVYLAERFFEGPLFAEGFLFDDNGLLRVALVVATIMIALYFNDLYESFQVRSRIQLIQQICLAVGVALLTQAFMNYIVTGWIVPRYTMIIGSAIVLIVSASLSNALCLSGVSRIRRGTSAFHGILSHIEGDRQRHPGKACDGFKEYRLSG